MYYQYLCNHRSSLVSTWLSMLVTLIISYGWAMSDTNWVLLNNELIKSCCIVIVFIGRFRIGFSMKYLIIFRAHAAILIDNNEMITDC
jgi:hypothetical protein